MSSVVISGDTSGAITLSAPAVSGTNTATLPAATGTVMVSGNQPAFSVYNSTGQTIGTGTYVKATFDTKVFDTASCWSTSTNRFTPNVAGYYQFTCSFGLAAGNGTGENLGTVRKNGSDVFYTLDQSGATVYASPGTGLIYMNGSTDYIEFYIFQSTGGNKTTNPGNSVTFLQGVLVRTA